ncbi:DUF6087 family protein [Streptomyces diastaticus]|uniref:Uncharacterized protein n=1 Tax=Streptomyces diastaticus subsp. diastaticus TaxID=68040 RepID=A0ABQ1CSA7_STRDI|nr:DUF6087 family protein [Streptomyces diastaticus]GFH73221.1 hypothetical protein Sdia_39890 [Streptomyces diastaticus subsp. diastaticus]GGU46020.1 hypothetical protein GCM10015534_55690 [Streptomyces diastaticus subsp. diastaticus]
MGKHRRPEPAVPRRAARERRRPARRVQQATPTADGHLPPSPTDARRRSHLRPDEPRILEEWDDFTYQVAGTAPNLAEAQNWVAELALDDDPAA